MGGFRNLIQQKAVLFFAHAAFGAAGEKSSAEAVPLTTQSELISNLSCMRACRALMLLAACSADAGMLQGAGLQARVGRCGCVHGQSRPFLRLRGGGGVTAGAARSKHEIMEELQALRQQRDAGTLSAADFETRKDALRREREAGKRSERGSVPGEGGHAAAEARPREDPALSKFRSVTWDMVARSRHIDSLEDPVSGAPLDKSEYLAIYGEMLRTLDGQDSLPDTFLDFFFERDAVNHGHLRFINEERKGDWYASLARSCACTVSLLQLMLQLARANLLRTCLSVSHAGACARAQARMDWAEEVGISPNLEAIKAGESAGEKQAREGRLQT